MREAGYSSDMGEFTICSDDTNYSTLIPNQFIDVYMKDANDAQLKVYLYLLRQFGAGRPASIQQMADTFNHTEKEVVRSLRYWEQKGLLSLETDAEGNLVRIRLCRMDTPAISRRQTVSSVPTIMVERPVPSAARQTAAAAVPDGAVSGTGSVTDTGSDQPGKGQQDTADSTRRSELFFIVEQYIGKPLSPLEMQKLNYIADDLHFSDDLIDFLVQYCVGNGKKDFRYIEKVAMNWAQEGISTTEKARENVARGPQKFRKTRRRSAASNTFNQFSQNEYNFEELEKQILNN